MCRGSYWRGRGVCPEWTPWVWVRTLAVESASPSQPASCHAACLDVEPRRGLPQALRPDCQCRPVRGATSGGGEGEGREWSPDERHIQGSGRGEGSQRGRRVCVRGHGQHGRSLEAERAPRRGQITLEKRWGSGKIKTPNPRCRPATLK